MKISIFAATQLELQLLQSQDMSALARQTGHQIQYCITGIGMLQSTFNIQQHIYANHPDFLLQIGIAGCFDYQIPLGTVLAVEREYLGSLGVAQPNWHDLFDLGLQDASAAPFDQKALINPHINQWPWWPGAGVLNAIAVTVDEITTAGQRMQALQAHYGSQRLGGQRPLLESMEGASLHYIGLQYALPFLQLRGVSNFTGQRDKSKWQISSALGALNAAARRILPLIK